MVYAYDCITKLCRHLKCSRYELELELLNPEKRRQAYKFFERFDLFFAPTRHQIQVTYFSTVPARQSLVFNGHKNINVEQFMLVRYFVDLRYPDLPCIVQEINGKPYFYPLETVTLRPRRREWEYDDEAASTSGGIVYVV